jgi:hypothetical protein
VIIGPHLGRRELVHSILHGQHTIRLVKTARSLAGLSFRNAVMPGHVGTNIIRNSFRGHGHPEPEQMSDAQVEELIPADARAGLTRAGLLREGASADELRQWLVRLCNDFRDKAPVTAAQAATVILDGVLSGAWRILVGEDAKMIDAAVRAKPEATYDYAELFRR